MCGADNQQERLDDSWISGFVDGEGCFYVGVNKLSKMTLCYQVLPEFRLVQHKRDLKILHRVRESLGVGVVRRNHGNRFELRVRSLRELNKLIEFFELHPLQTKKRNDYMVFKRIVQMMNNREHLTLEGIKKIAVSVSSMNRQTRPLSRILRDYTQDT